MTFNRPFSQQPDPAEMPRHAPGDIHTLNPRQFDERLTVTSSQPLPPTATPTASLEATGVFTVHWQAIPVLPHYM